MGAIYLVRHGQASFGAADYDQLSQTGERQARLLGEWLQQTGQTFEGVGLGAQRRHRQSAEACMQALGQQCDVAEWSVDADFNEFDHELILHRLHPEFADHAVLRAFLSEQQDPHKAFQQIFVKAVERWVGGEFAHEYDESWQQFQQRCRNALHTLVERAGASQNLIVFTSGGPISAICQHLMGIPDARVFDLNWSLINTGVTRLLYGRNRITVSSLNTISHLELARETALITYR